MEQSQPTRPATGRRKRAAPARDAHADEAEIRALADAWSRALEARDLDRLLANYASDVLLFDLKPPFEIRGKQAYRAMWEACLPYFPERFECERRDLQVAVGGDVAFAHCLHRINALGEDSEAGETWLRVTIGYQRMGGCWCVTHEHVSIPFDPTTGKAVYITDTGAGPEVAG